MIKVIKRNNSPQLAIWWLPRQLGCEHLGVIMKVISDYDYNTNVIDYDYDYIAFESHDYDYDYDYLRSCNRLQSITITDYDYPIPDQHHPSVPPFVRPRMAQLPPIVHLPPPKNLPYPQCPNYVPS